MPKPEFIGYINNYHANTWLLLVLELTIDFLNVVWELAVYALLGLRCMIGLYPTGYLRF